MAIVLPSGPAAQASTSPPCRPHDTRSITGDRADVAVIGQHESTTAKFTEQGSVQL